MIRRTFFSALAACFLLVSGAALLAAGDDIKVKAGVDKAFITIGDPVAYTVTVEHAPDIQILSKVPPPDSDILEIKKIEDINRKEGKKSVSGRKFTLTTYKLGEFVLDPVAIRYQREGQEEKTLLTQKIYLTVKSVAEGDPKEDIRDVKPVIPLTRRFAWLLVVLAAAILAPLAFILLKRFLKKAAQPPATESPLTAGEQALKDLRELFESDLLKRGFIKLYYLRLSEILRVYFEKCYGILAVESTTFEIMRALRGESLPRELYEKIQNVLSSADLAKFAKWVPSPAETVALNRQSEEIVLESSPYVSPTGTSGNEQEAPRGV